MSNILNVLLFADETAGGLPPWVSTVVIVAIIGLMIVMMIIPQRRNKKKAEEMMKGLRVGSKITTIGGVIGEVIELDENGNFTLVTGTGDNKSTMCFTKGAIYTVNSETAKPVERAQASEEIDEIK